MDNKNVVVIDDIRYLIIERVNYEDKTFAYISDGGIQEEISQGAGRLAGTLGLGNLIMYYDANEVQLSTRVEDVTTEDTAAKYQAWGWSVLDVDGPVRHHLDALAMQDMMPKAYQMHGRRRWQRRKNQHLS